MDEGHAWNFQRDGGRLGLVSSGTQVGQRSSVQHFNVIISNCKFTEAKIAENAALEEIPVGYMRSCLVLQRPAGAKHEEFKHTFTEGRLTAARHEV